MNRALPLSFLFPLLSAFCPPAATAHAPQTPAPQGPFRTQGNKLVDNNGFPFVLRGVQISGLQLANVRAGSLEEQTLAAMNGVTFGIIRRRWNMNAVRLPVSVGIWRRDGQRYLDRVGQIVRIANERDLIVILAACEDVSCGAPEDLGMPTAETAAFWRAWAAYFRDNLRVIFDVYNQPSARNVPGAAAGRRTAADWRFWLRGGALAGGRQAVGMQDLVQAIRAAGAQQPVAVPAFHDALGFRGFAEEFHISGNHVIYTVHPRYDFGSADDAWNAAFGFVAARFPVYAGEWGLSLRQSGPACQSLPPDPQRVLDLLFRTMAYFDIQQISWTAAAFEPGSLIQDFSEFQPTRLDRPWTCGQAISPQPGMGEAMLLWLTGDSGGFGVLRADLIANAAGGPGGVVAPGELVSIYVEQLGADPPRQAQLDASGRLPLSLGGTQVLFDGIPVPLLYSGPFQINVQAPYSLAGKSSTTVQVFHEGVPSSRAATDVAAAAPELFYEPGTRITIALNQDGSRHTSASPAAPGSIMVFFASGAGQTAPPGVTGAPAPAPHPLPVLPVSMTVDGQPAEVLFAGEVPGFVGLFQINARLPAFEPSAFPRALPVVLGVGPHRSRSVVFLWGR